MKTPPPTKANKDQLLKLIEELTNKPNDRVRSLSEIGITAFGAGLGAAAAGSVAATVGATSIFGITSAAGWVGLSIVGTTPVGWVLAVAATAGIFVYTLSRWIRSGGRAEGSKAELLTKYREEARIFAAKEEAGNITVSDRIRFIVALRELIANDLIVPDVAFRFIEQVESGRLPISQAFSLISRLLEEAMIRKKSAPV